MKEKTKRMLEASIRSEMEPTLRTEIQSNVHAEVVAKVHAELESMFNKYTEESIDQERVAFQLQLTQNKANMDQERTAFQHQLAQHKADMDQERTAFRQQLTQNKATIDFTMDSAKKKMEETSKQLNGVLKAVTEANARAERAENKTVEYKERMNQALQRLAELEAQFLSPSRRNVVAIAEEQEKLVANDVDVHTMILSDVEQQEPEMGEDVEMEPSAGVKGGSQGVEPETNMGSEQDMHNAENSKVDDRVVRLAQSTHALQKEKEPSSPPPLQKKIPVRKSSGLDSSR